MRPCDWCPGEIPAKMRKDARFCSDACRQASSRANRRAKSAPAELPRALTKLPRWVRRSAAKTPLTVRGTAARANDPSTWSTYDDAAESRAGAGLGFVLNGDGIVCVDLDHCLVDGHPTDEAAEYLAHLPATYIEVSPSGDGLHIWGRGLVLTSRKIRRPGLAGEVIGARKYVTVTGRRWRGAPAVLADISRQTAPLIY